LLFHQSSLVSVPRLFTLIYFVFCFQTRKQEQFELNSPKMSDFTPHIAISIAYPQLELPIHFRPDDIEILVNATPEERAIVVNTGCVALRALKDQKPL
jgi:hypothetical protein